MTEHDEIRNSPEYLQWMEQELLNQIIQKKKLIDIIGSIKRMLNLWSQN